MYYYKKTCLYTILLLLVISCLFLSSCETIGVDTKTRSIGAPGEILLVMDKKLQNSQVKEIIQAFADNEFPNLPQPEATFKLTTISPANFDGHFKAYRNIIIVQQKLLTIADVKFPAKTWVKDQQVVEITIPDLDSFESLFESYQQQIFHYIYHGDINNLQKANLASTDASVQHFIKQKHALQLTIPRGFKLVKDTANFCWFRLDRLETSVHLVIQSFDIESFTAINNNTMLSLLDSTGKKYIPGPFELTFKQTEKEIPILFDKITVNQQSVVELRGLWKVEGFFMGGPFVTYFIKDDSRKKLIMIDGFLHAPQKQNKAYYVRQIEAILRSVKIV